MVDQQIIITPRLHVGYIESVDCSFGYNQLELIQMTLCHRGESYEFVR
jgi:hypothetical protein